MLNPSMPGGNNFLSLPGIKGLKQFLNNFLNKIALPAILCIFPAFNIGQIEINRYMISRKLAKHS